MIVPTQVDASHGGRTVLVPGQIVGMPLPATGPRVDTLSAEAGRSLRPGDARARIVVLDRAFAHHYGLPAAGPCTPRRPRADALCGAGAVATVLPGVRHRLVRR